MKFLEPIENQSTFKILFDLGSILQSSFGGESTCLSKSTNVIFSIYASWQSQAKIFALSRVILVNQRASPSNRDTKPKSGDCWYTSYPTQFTILSTQRNEKATIAANGFAADCKQLVKRVKWRLETYKHAHNREMPLKSIARMVQTMLYGKRFFPFYSYVIIGGIDDDGTGAVYGFDPVGSYERETCRAAGAAQSLLQPFLDNQIYFRNQQPADPTNPPIPGTLPLDNVLAIVTDSFTGATERHIEVGDALEMYVVTNSNCDLGALQQITQSATKTDLEQVAREEAEFNGPKSCKTFKLLRQLKKD
ncbi:hypothetical protein E3P77_02812 [Wallemia ichthyophaga]|uniref:Proteasome subunit alpha type-6 n=1 Tax=Wallemia ichthyophaga TaxID=245174 RepID=A0A4T0H281_WALIC|nr:hypothetical protein E3P91_03382 [Wallemia ichthyophaga]TIA88341.1 hypothetical protein E3P97_03562 [Wallemia ichthyophaga]TIA96468.1 hypothetical protein E3P95_03270 [Wallemia ichthyophaga]TIA97435.1 hypothetical protein E3P94_03329 [Wallemia ichthyophaga]TIA98131.1 hypothetical protein E3P96_03230 [Wallemia ichthyophaga]